jgi:hypothetical protein
MDFLYATTLSKFAEGKQFRNATMFSAPDPRATKVYIVGNHPLVANAYSKRGVEIVHIAPDDPRLTGASAAVQKPSSSLPDRPEFSQEQKSAVPIPPDWESMPWADLRRLAASLSTQPVPNKKIARTIVLDELTRRGDEG